ncbi:MAG: ABC transporter ATP-binding protein [Thermoleophilia bacterium]|nr:ABC transporter ATP-binding protein [Thermoleophilia bacterium]
MQTGTGSAPVPVPATGDLSVPTYDLTGVSKVYGSGATGVEALSDIDLRVEQRDFLAIVGASGSGKTTLLQLLGALDRPSAGTVRCNGRDIQSMGEGELSRLRRDVIGFVFQQFNLIPTLTARQNVELVAASTEMPAAARAARAAELLDSVGLAAREGHLPSQLSGGEQQRVAIARALMNRPRVILADEPTGNLDSATGAEILALLQRVAADNHQTLVLITHEQAVTEAAPRVVTLRDGRLASDTRA